VNARTKFLKMLNAHMLKMVLSLLNKKCSFARHVDLLENNAAAKHVHNIATLVMMLLKPKKHMEDVLAEAKMLLESHAYLFLKLMHV